MALRDWSTVTYLPILSLRPAEMRALEELPNLTKDRLLPVVHLRPWTTSHRLESATKRIAEAYGDRPIIIAMGEKELGSDKRPVFAELEELRSPRNGFHEWCRLFEENSNYIPAVQFCPDISAEEKQISRLFALDRGLAVIIEAPAFPAIQMIAERIGHRSQGGKDICIVIDFGHANRDHLEVAARALGYIATIRKYAPAAHIALSASSFPDNFVGRTEQQIYERRLFDTLSEIPNLIYSDRGSAKVERQTGGGGLPAPRVDYPLLADWKFFRCNDGKIGFSGYREQAQALMDTAKAGIWNPNLRVWGTQMIERTAAGDTSAIGSPQKATAARINIHLQRQAFYDDPSEAEDTDEEWLG